MRFLIIVLFLAGCGVDPQTEQPQQQMSSKQSVVEVSEPVATVYSEPSAAKLTSTNCTDPDLTKVIKGTKFMLCDGTIGEGSLVIDPQPDLTNLVPDNVRSGVTVAGVTGTLVQSEAPALCSGNSQVGCVTTSAWKSADLTNLAPENIMTGTTIAGVSGSLSLGNFCTSNYQVNCIANASFRAVDPTFIESHNIRAGVTIAGVSGTLPTYDSCNANNQTGCIATTTYRSANLTNLSADNIRSGVSIAGVSGNIDLSDVAPQNIRVGISIAGITGTLDPEDVSGLTADVIKSGVTVAGVTGTLVQPERVDVRMGQAGGNGGSGLLNTKCTNAVQAGTSTGLDDLYADGVSREGGCNSIQAAGETNLYLDQYSGMHIYLHSRVDNWTISKNYCQNLTIYGMSGWRLPSQKEIAQLYINGLSTILPQVNDNNHYYWTSTSRAGSATTHAWVQTVYGLNGSTLKTEFVRYFCVR